MGGGRYGAGYGEGKGMRGRGMVGEVLEGGGMDWWGLRRGMGEQILEISFEKCIFFFV